MHAVGNDRHQIQWTVIKVVRGQAIDGVSSAIQIRQGMTESGNLTFSYVAGVFVVDHSKKSGERWVPYRFIPDRYALDYLRLLEEAVERVRGAMRDAEKTDEGRLTPEALRVAVVRAIRRRR